MLGLSARPISPTAGEIALAGAAPGGTGILGVSTCSATQWVPPYRILIALGGNHLLGHVPFVYDQGGRFRVGVPLKFALPAFIGSTLFMQGAQVSPTVGLSNGLRIDLTP